MKRRFHIVPFPHKPPVANKQLSQQLRAEYPAILAWMIEGAQEWYKVGLCPPPEVIAATEDYLAGEDDLGRWLDECCRKAEEGETLLGPAGPMYDNWSRWCLTEGAYQGSQVIFNKRMRDAGYRPRQSGLDAYFEGLDLNEANKPKAEKGQP
jgi:putative DNA primase/helicase